MLNLIFSLSATYNVYSYLKSTRIPVYENLNLGALPVSFASAGASIYETNFLAGDSLITFVFSSVATSSYNEILIT